MSLFSCIIFWIIMKIEHISRFPYATCISLFGPSYSQFLTDSTFLLMCLPCLFRFYILPKTMHKFL